MYVQIFIGVYLVFYCSDMSTSDFFISLESLRNGDEFDAFNLRKLLFVLR